jgi:chaperonin GroEL (HSP60 family)
MDKILISPDGDINVSNDGATILGQMHVSSIHVLHSWMRWAGNGARGGGAMTGEATHCRRELRSAAASGDGTKAWS